MDFNGFPHGHADVKKWYPRIFQNGQLTISPDTYGLVRTDGMWVTAYAEIFPTQSGTSANAIIVAGFPYPTQIRRVRTVGRNCLGAFMYNDVSVGTVYSGSVGPNNDTSGFPTERNTLWLWDGGAPTSALGNTGGPSFQVESGDSLSLTLSFPFLYSDYATQRQP